MNGKGDKDRTSNFETYRKNFDKIFRKPVKRKARKKK